MSRYKILMLLHIMDDARGEGGDVNWHDAESQMAIREFVINHLLHEWTDATFIITNGLDLINQSHDHSLRDHKGYAPCDHEEHGG